MRFVRCNDGGQISHVKRHAVLNDDFQRPSSSPQRRQLGAISILPARGRINKRLSANVVGDGVLLVCERQLLDVDQTGWTNSMSQVNEYVVAFVVVSETPKMDIPQCIPLA